MPRERGKRGDRLSLLPFVVAMTPRSRTVVPRRHPVLVASAAVSARVLVVVVLSALLLGCSTHLAGTNDAALDYDVKADPGGGAAPSAEVVAAGVKARLAAAQLAADVDPAGDARVRVVAD